MRFMLRHFLKRNRNVVELMKCHCREFASEENGATSSGEIWDDPLQAVMSKTGVMTYVLNYLANIVLIFSGTVQSIEFG